MKQESPKKSKLWLWLVVALAALVAVGGVLLALLLPGQQTDPQGETVNAELYWNLDREQFIEEATGMSTRTKESDGMYHMRFAYKGEQVELKCRDPLLVNRLDSYSAVVAQVALLFDEEGYIIDNTDISLAIRGKYLCQYYTVTAIEGDQVTAERIQAGTEQGMVKTFTLDESCDIFMCCSGCHDSHIGERTDHLRVGDTVNVYTDLDGVASLIFVSTRPVDSKLYYNLAQKYNSVTKETRREPENGYYVFEMITNGKTVTVKTKDKDMASFIDAQSAPTVALKVSGGIIKEAHLVSMAVKYGIVRDNYVYVDKVNKDGTYTTYYYSGETRVPGTVARKIAKNCKIYNVSAAYAKYRGESTTLKPNDRIQAIVSGDTGEAVMLFVLSRDVDSPMYYHVKRQYDTTKAETRRVPNADGWYVFDLAVNGQIKQFKTKDKAIASEVDQFSAPFVMITEGDVILRAFNATYHKDVKANAAGQYDVMAIDGSKVTLTRNRPLADNYGDTKELTLTKNVQVYDVSSYASSVGAKTTLKVGDRVTCYADDNGDISFIFVNYASTRKAGHISYCDHCQKDVFWNPYTGEFYETDAHYYLPYDIDTGKGKTIGEKKAYSICLDLNGHSFSTKARPFLIYSELSVLDSAGGGSIVGQCTYLNTLGGCINVARGGKLSLYGGTLTLQAGGITPGKGGVVNVGYEAVFNMYGGAVKGGYVTDQGGNIFVNGSTFNMYGGTVEGGTADLAGGNIAAVQLPENAQCAVSGTPVVGMMTLMPNAKLTLGELTEGASITVAANGVFTAPSDLAERLVGFFHAANEGDTITTTQEKALVYTPAQSSADPYTGELKLDADGTAVCPVCQVKVTWTALTEKRVNMAGGTHYYVAEDVTYEGGTNWYITAPASGTACLHLNGKNLTSPTKAIQGNTGALNVMGSGTVTGNYTDAANPKRGAVVDTTPSTADCAQVTSINLLGGTYQAAAGNTQENAISIWDNGGRIRLDAGATVKGGIYVGKSNILLSELAILGGTVEGSITLAGSSKNTSTLNLSGGSIAAVALPANAVCNVSGAPVVADMQLAEGAKLTLGELTEGASLTVSANGVFTEAKDNISDYTAFFTPAEGYELTIQDNALAGISKSTGEPEDPSTAPYDGTLALDAQGYAKCPVCNESVLWTDLNSLSDSRLGFKNDKAAYDAGTPVSYHYYLSDDLAYAKSSQYAERYYNINCLHLNGHALSFNSRMSIGIGATLNIMGSGSLTGSCNSSVAANNTSVLYTYNGGVINLYSGSYNCTNKDVPAVLIGSHAPTQVNIYDGVTVTGGVTAKNGTVTISGDSNVDLLTIGTPAKLTVSADWTGTAQASFASQITDGVIPAKNGASLGAYTGILTMDSKAVVGKDGALVVRTFDPNTDDGVLKILGIGNSYTQRCHI